MADGTASGGDDLYVTPEPSGPPPQGATADPRTNRRIEADLMAGTIMDPLDMLDRPTVQLLWAQEGQRLLAREDSVRAVAAEHEWTFEPLDARLSAHLVDTDITAGCPRVARHVCARQTGVGATVIDLTGVTFHRDGTVPVDLRLRAGTAGVVAFRSDHRLAVVPTRAQTSSWHRFGDGIATESADFDARYRVHARDLGWALIVLNPALMQRLLEHWPMTLVIAGGQLAAITPGWVPAGALRDFQEFTEHLALSAQGAKSDAGDPRA